jgi:hypothetical protein
VGKDFLLFIGGVKPVLIRSFHALHLNREGVKSQPFSPTTLSLRPLYPYG